MHKGVGLIIRNKTKDLFFIQKKDANYPIVKWIGAYSFWGGAIENTDNSTFEALERELQEELNFKIDSTQVNFIGEYMVNSDEDYQFYLYELLMDTETIQSLTKLKVNEGNFDFVTKEQLLNGNWIWGLEQVFADYM